jgi:hypothetical protein
LGDVGVMKFISRNTFEGRLGFKDRLKWLTNKNLPCLVSYAKWGYFMFSALCYLDHYLTLQLDHSTSNVKKAYTYCVVWD